jgi:hypothetical protein
MLRALLRRVDFDLLIVSTVLVGGSCAGMALFLYELYLLENPDDGE